jgi:hypothetical protein
MATKEEIAANLITLAEAVTALKNEMNKMFGELSDRLGNVELSQAGAKQQVAETFHSLTAGIEGLKTHLFSTVPPPPPSVQTALSTQNSAAVTFNIPMGQVLKALLPDVQDPDAMALALNPQDPKVLSKIEKDYAKGGNKINAIKELRSRTGLGLKDAKDAVEAWLLKNGLSASHPY